MAKYTLLSTKEDYADITIVFDDGTEVTQNLCGMPTDDATALVARLDEYVQNYEKKLAPEPPVEDEVPADVRALYGVERTVSRLDAEVK